MAQKCSKVQPNHERGDHANWSRSAPESLCSKQDEALEVQGTVGGSRVGRNRSKKKSKPNQKPKPKPATL